MLSPGPFILGLVVFFALVVLLKSVQVVPQKQVKLIERLGKFHKKAEAGLNIILPFFDAVRATIDLREQITQIEPQPVITRDNVTMEVDAVIYYVVADPIRATVTQAEGEKSSAILRAEGQKQSQIVSAEGQKESAILAADGQAQARLRVATAEAQAIEVVARAIGATGNPAQYLIAQRYLESLTQIAAGSSKIVFMPFEAAGVMGSIGSMKELFDATSTPAGGRPTPPPPPPR